MRVYISIDSPAMALSSHVFPWAIPSCAHPITHLEIKSEVSWLRWDRDTLTNHKSLDRLTAVTLLGMRHNVLNVCSTRHPATPDVLTYVYRRIS